MIKNYTSSVPVERTVAKIEAALVAGGATNILKDYQGGRLVAICFMVANPADGRKMAVRLPANVEAVHTALMRKVKRPRKDTTSRTIDQASRTAWKLAQDWVELQMTRIALGQSDFLQAFLSEVWDGKRTFYAALKDSGFSLLEGGDFKLLAAGDGQRG